MALAVSASDIYFENIIFFEISLYTDLTFLRITLLELFIAKILSIFDSCFELSPGFILSGL